MIKEQMTYPVETTYANGTEATKQIPNNVNYAIPVTDYPFPTAYWLGYVTPQNAPLTALVSQMYLDDEGNFSIKPCVSANIDVGYGIYTSTTSYPTQWNMYYNTKDYWSTTSTSGGAKPSFPNKFAIYTSGVNNKIKLHCARITGTFKTSHSDLDGRFDGYSDAGYFEVTLDLDQIYSPDATVVLDNYIPSACKSTVIGMTVKVSDLVNGFTYKDWDANDMKSTTNGGGSTYVFVTSFSFDHLSPWNPDGSTGLGDAYSLIPMYKTDFTLSHYEKVSDSVVKSGDGGSFFIDNSSVNGFQGGFTNKVPLIATSSNNYYPFYTTSTSAINNEGILTTEAGKRTTVYSGYNIDVDSKELGKRDIYFGTNCCMINRYSSTSNFLIYHIYDFAKIIHDMSFNSRVLKNFENVSTFTNDERVEVTKFLYPKVTSSGEFTGELIATTESYKRRDLQPWQYADDVTDANTYDSGKDKPNYRPGGGSQNEDFGNLKSTTHSITSYNAGTSLYAATYQQIRSFIDYMNGSYTPTIEDFNKDFKGINPFEYVVGLMWFPFDINAGLAQEIVVGPIGTGVTSNLLAADILYFNFGTRSIDRFFNDFRDFEGYTNITLELPFCGSTKLSTNFWMGHDISLTMVVDLPTGKCSIYIFRDQLIVETKNGSCGSSVPITLKNMSDYKNTLESLNYQREQNKNAMITAQMQGAVGLASSASMAHYGNIPGGALQAGAHLSNMISTDLTYNTNESHLQYQYKHTQPSVGAIGSASPVIDAYGEYVPRLIITRPKKMPIDDAIYSSTVGYACNEGNTISNFKGFTVFGDVKLNVSATVDEINSIKTALTSGVYL